MSDTSKVRRRSSAVVVLALIAVAIGPVSSVQAASGTATLVQGTVVPPDPPMGGIVRLELMVRNDGGSNWSANDPVHLSWKRADGKTVAEDTRQLGQPVATRATVALNLVTLAPTAVGDFTLTADLEDHGSQLAIGAPTPYHLNGFLFTGKGNGHGLGMSQWGARGRASAGQDYRKILATYYPHTKIESRDTSGQVRIALSDDPIDLARPWPRLFGPLPFIAGPVSVDGVPQLEVGATSSLGFDTDAAGQPIAFLLSANGSRGAPVVIKQTMTIRTASAAGIRTNIMQVMGGDFRTGAEQRRYAGILQVIPKGGATILPVNVLPMEDYLKGVVPAEMPAYWGVEALKAQAIAGRTYALEHLGGADFDLRASEADQAYSGLTDQRAESNAAVDGTKGQVLTYQGNPIVAFYMASDGGHTESSEYRFVTWDHGPQLRSHLGYLSGISDSFDRAPSWQVGPFSAAGAATVLRDSGQDIGDRLLGIDILQKDASGRLVGVRLRGSSATVEISGPRLRAWFGLPDTLVQIVGGG
ncbi:MAG TPA: SpoIID/LytB domain-containing protein [Candidatus Dormibacteraeota bacterium]|nr:SpoIID/LytB domain-containing protein [Candidatus Dormibacteraeota bacterium]